MDDLEFILLRIRKTDLAERLYITSANITIWIKKNKVPDVHLKALSEIRKELKKTVLLNEQFDVKKYIKLNELAIKQGEKTSSILMIIKKLKIFLVKINEKNHRFVCITKKDATIVKKFLKDGK
jgi:hypothetical protein